MNSFLVILILLVIGASLLSMNSRTSSEAFSGFVLGTAPMIRYVRISRSGAPLQLAEVAAFMGKRNVAPVHGHASQSSTKDNDLVNYGPNLAINGNNTGAKFFHVATTDASAHQHWWLLDLQVEMPISTLLIHLPERGTHPAPLSTWYETSRDKGTVVECLDRNHTLVFTKTIDTWEEIIIMRTSK